MIQDSANVVPLYVSHRRWIPFAFGLSFIIYSVIFVRFIVADDTAADLESLTTGSIFVYGLLIAQLSIGLYLISAFLKSRRIEFYNSSMRVFLSFQGEATKDISYSEMEIGPPMVRVGAIGPWHFKVYMKGERNGFWVIGDGKVKGTDYQLYSWLRNKMETRIRTQRM